MGCCRLMKRKLDAALTLSVHDWLVLAQAWLLLLVFDLSVRLLPFHRVQKVAALAMKGEGEQRGSQVLRAVEKTEHLVSIAGRYHLYPMHCLPRALVLQWLLGRQGIGTELRIGVRKEMAQLSAHAWLEYKGQPLGEPQDIALRFVPLAAAEAEQ